VSDATPERPHWLVTDFDGYWKAQGYTRTGTEYDRDDLSDAFEAGMQAARDLVAVSQASKLRGMVRELIGGIVSGAWAMRGADRRLLRIAEDAGIEPPAILRLPAGPGHEEVSR
jgi:hypothetical protein